MRRLLPIVLVLAIPAAAFAQAGDADVTESFRRGLSAFEQGQYEQAYLEFEKVLAGQPSHALAMRLRDEAGVHRLFKILSSRHDELATVIRKILSLAEKGALRERQDPTVIKALLQDLKSDDFNTQYLARENIIAKVGHYVIPYVVDVLGDRHDDKFRVRVIDLLVAMGYDAVLPVMEVLESKEALTRQNAAAILGHIGDARAVPALLKVTGLPQEDRLVKAEATEAIRKITGRDPGSLGDVQDVYLATASRYYLDDPALVRSSYKEWTVWKWRSGKLVYDNVERNAYNEEMAEEFCYDALEINPAHQGLWTLLVCVYYAELAEINSILGVAEERGEEGVIPESELQLLRAAADTLQHVRALNAAAGKKLLYQALRLALDDRMVPVAELIIDAIRELGVDPDSLPPGGANSDRTFGYGGSGGLGDAEPMAAGDAGDRLIAQGADRDGSSRRAPAPSRTNLRRRTVRTPGRGTTQPGRGEAVSARADRYEAAPLVAALEYPDKRVRYAAARCLASANPTRAFQAHEKVVQNLAEALGESGPRVVLIIEPDLTSRNRLSGVFKRLNYMTVDALTGYEGINRAMSFPAEDLIVVSTNLDKNYPQDASFSQAIDTLRNDVRTQHIPIVLAAESKRQKELSDIYEGRVERVISQDIDEVAIRPILDEIFDTEKSRRDAKARAEEISKIAAETLAELDPHHAVYQPDQALSALIGTLAGRSDMVRIPAMLAIGRLQAREAIPMLTQIFSDSRNGWAVRVAAADALGGIIGARGDITPQTFAALREALSDPDRRIREASGRALGKASLSPEDRLSVFQEQRIEK